MNTLIYQYAEIVKLKENDLINSFLNNIFEIETYSKDDDKETKFLAEIINYTLTQDEKVFSFEIKVDGELDSKELLILKVKSMKLIRTSN